MRITRARIDQGIAYLKDNKKPKPDWLPVGAELKAGHIYVAKQEVVPYEDRNIYIGDMYKDPKQTGGRDSLYEKVKERYYGISRRDVAAYLANNETHQLHQPLPKRQTARRIIVKGPDRVAQIDLVDLNELKGHNAAKRYMLTYVDLFSKWGAARPITTKTAANVQAALLDILPSTNVSTIQSDNGKEFGPSLSKTLAGMDIKLIHSSPYKPTTQGAIERYNGTLKRTLYRLMDVNSTKKWTELLQDVVGNYNNTTHSVTGWKPAELKEAKLTDDEIEVIQAKMRGPPAADEKVFAVGDTVRLALTIHASERKKGTFRKGYKQNWTSDVFEVTHVSQPEQENDRPQYQVKNLTTNRAWNKKLWGYQMQQIDTEKLVKRPAKPPTAKRPDNVEPAEQPEEKKEKRERKAPAPGMQRAAKVLKQASDEYVVKRIIKEAKQGNRKLYLVEWKDYPNEKDYTWEPASNLAGNVTYLAWKEK